MSKDTVAQSREEAGRLIIELFGPQGAGKTTFAHALTSWLREHGKAVQLIHNSRPAEHLASPSYATEAAAMVRRLSRPVVDMLMMAHHPFANSRHFGAAANLLGILPPKDIFQTIRLGQYLSRLSSSWQLASNTGDIALFDQAFVHAVCSLALRCQAADDALIARALESTPKADLLIHLDAPPKILEVRLRDRLSSLSPIERMLELDTQTCLRSIRIAHQLHNLLLKRNRSVICARSLDQRSLCELVEAIGKQVMTSTKSQ